MDLITFNDYADLGEYLYNLADEGKVASAVLFKKKLVNLLRWLIEYDEIDLCHIDIKDELVDGYSKEYYLTIDRDLSVFIEPVYEDNTNDIIPCYSDVVLFDGEASSKIAIENDNCFQVEFNITDNDDNCGDCCYDCSNCPKSASQAISSALSMIDYIFNHFNDND